MALPPVRTFVKASGDLSFQNDIVAEFGGGEPHSLSEYYGQGIDPSNSIRVPESGPLSFSDFYDRSSEFTNYRNTDIVVVDGTTESTGIPFGTVTYTRIPNNTSVNTFEFTTETTTEYTTVYRYTYASNFQYTNGSFTTTYTYGYTADSTIRFTVVSTRPLTTELTGDFTLEYTTDFTVIPTDDYTTRSTPYLTQVKEGP